MCTFIGWLRTHVPAWSTIQTFGKLRFLRVSYALLVLIPAWAAACNSLNVWLEPIGVSPFVDQVETLHKKLEVLQSLPEYSHFGDLRLTIARWLKKAKLFQFPLHFNLSFRLRIIFFMALCISIATFCYQAWCPQQLRYMSYITRMSGSTRLGPHLDWQLTALNALKSGDKERIRLVQEFLTGELASSEDLPDDLLDVVELSWISLNQSAPVARAACLLFYTFGSILMLYWLVLQVREVLQ